MPDAVSVVSDDVAGRCIVTVSVDSAVVAGRCIRRLDVVTGRCIVTVSVDSTVVAGHCISCFGVAGQYICCIVLTEYRTWTRLPVVAVLVIRTLRRLCCSCACY